MMSEIMLLSDSPVWSDGSHQIPEDDLGGARIHMDRCITGLSSVVSGRVLVTNIINLHNTTPLYT